MTGDEFERMARGIRASVESAGCALQPLVQQQQHLAAQMQPIAETGHRIVQALQPFVRQIPEILESVGRALQPFVQQQQHLTAQMQAIVETGHRIAQALQPFVRQIQEMRERLAPFLDEVRRVSLTFQKIPEIPERNRKALRILAVNGWYLDSEMPFPDVLEAADLFEAGTIERAHQNLCDHFDNRLSAIHRDLCSRFSKRSRILAQAFDAHRKCEYALAIPVFLSQADGICHDLIGVQLYERRNGIPRLAACLPVEKETPLGALFLYPLVSPNPISAGPAERSGLVDLFNRHTILHGESCDYDTRLNSCRALSWIVYVAWILERGQTGESPEPLPRNNDAHFNPTSQ